MDAPGSIDQPMNTNLDECVNKHLDRTLRLIEVQDWCMERLSKLSLIYNMDDARALTSEHKEMLESINVHTTLWMMIEEDA